VYSVVANEIIDGGRPYVDAVERKPPLLFLTYAVVFKIAGKYNWKALHAVALLWTLGTMADLYVIGRRLFNRETGLIAALLYGVFQPWAAANNLAFNGELVMNLPLVWAWAIASDGVSHECGPNSSVRGFCSNSPQQSRQCRWKFISFFRATARPAASPATAQQAGRRFPVDG
jgi:hypothetical protein